MQKELTLQQIGAHTYWLPPDSATDRPALGVVAGTRGALVVDAGNSPAHAGVLQRELAAHAVTPRFAMLTHWHWDHVFGAATLALPTFAHAETARIVRVMAGLDWSDAALDERVAAGTEIAFCRDMLKAEMPDRSALVIRPPEIIFEDQLTLDLGGVTCSIMHVGGDHAHDSSIVAVPDDRVAFLGDCFYDDLHHGARRLTCAALFPLLDRLLALGAETYIGGHDPAPITRATFADDAALLRQIGELVAEIGDDREAVLAALPGRTALPVVPDHIEIADVFLAGLRMPHAPSVL